MERKGKVVWAKAGVIVLAIPVLLWAYEYGPDPGYAGVPGENGAATCANSQCHVGTANNPANKGSVTVTFPNGLTYTPGVKQHLTVTIADPAATQRAWGF
jgi:predicted CxxxxCH...CXXCH cytochrome family protein